MARQIDVRVDGIKELENRFKTLEKEGRKRVARQINVNALEYQRAVRKTIRKRTGRHIRYRSRKDGSRWHWSSSPGAPPNSDTGNLAGQIRVTRRASSVQTKMGAFVISGAKYSSALEFRRDRSKRRPFMIPVINKNRKLFVERIKRAIMGLI